MKGKEFFLSQIHCSNGVLVATMLSYERSLENWLQNLSPDLSGEASRIEPIEPERIGGAPPAGPEVKTCSRTVSNKQIF